jgi:hypothetical protein
VIARACWCKQRTLTRNRLAHFHHAVSAPLFDERSRRAVCSLTTIWSVHIPQSTPGSGQHLATAQLRLAPVDEDREPTLSPLVSTHRSPDLSGTARRVSLLVQLRGELYGLVARSCSASPSQDADLKASGRSVLLTRAPSCTLVCKLSRLILLHTEGYRLPQSRCNSLVCRLPPRTPVDPLISVHRRDLTPLCQTIQQDDQ